jgi:hypothetical protein
MTPTAPALALAPLAASVALGIGTAGSPPSSQAADSVVTSLPALQEAIGRAVPGDRIVLADGVYESGAPLVVGCSGTGAAPVVIEAASVGGAEISGAAGFEFAEPAAFVVLRGFRFTHQAGTVRVPAGVHHCRLTRNVFQLDIPEGGRAPYLVVAGDDIEVDHNTFRHKATEGQMLYVQGPGSDGMAQRTWVHHNFFYDFKPTANNCSAVHIGHSARSLTPAHSLVEHNLFVNCRGENEGAICNKSCDNTYRYNTIGEGSTELSLRHGNRCLVYANYFLGCSGLRFFGDDHRVFSNYFERCRPAIAIGNGGGDVPPAALTSHDRPQRVHVTFNTLADNRENVRMSRRNRGLGADDLVFAHNLIVGGESAVTTDGPLARPAWEQNVIWDNDGGPGDLPLGGYTELDPGLMRSTDGPLRPAASALAQASRDHDPRFAYVTVDIDGQPRGAVAVPGADQPSTAPSLNPILTPDDVGPGAREPERPLIMAPVPRRTVSP